MKSDIIRKLGEIALQRKLSGFPWFSFKGVVFPGKFDFYYSSFENMKLGLWETERTIEMRPRQLPPLPACQQHVILLRKNE